MTPYELARTQVGTLEKKVGHNPTIIGYFAEVGHSWVTDDETAWCSAFVGAMLERAGIRSTRSLAARSYLQWGEPVERKDAKPGDVVVFWRGAPDGWQGHVAFFVKDNGLTLTVLGGNQSDQVCETQYLASKVLGIRRAPAAPAVVTPPSPLLALFNSLVALFRRK